MNELVLRALRLLLVARASDLTPDLSERISEMVSEIDGALEIWQADVLITPREPYIDPMTGTKLPEGD